VCSSLCTIVAHNTTENRPDNFLSCPPDNHNGSNDVYLNERGVTRLGKSYSSASLSRESKRLKKSSSWLNSCNALILQHLRENAILRWPVLPRSAEAQVNWRGTVKCLFIAYFIGNIPAKKYENPFTCVKVIASQRWDVFGDTVYTALFYRFYTLACRGRRH